MLLIELWLNWLPIFWLEWGRLPARFALWQLFHFEHWTSHTKPHRHDLMLVYRHKMLLTELWLNWQDTLQANWGCMEFSKVCALAVGHAKWDGRTRGENQRIEYSSHIINHTAWRPFLPFQSEGRHTTSTFPLFHPLGAQLSAGLLMRTRSSIMTPSLTNTHTHTHRCTQTHQKHTRKVSK